MTQTSANPAPASPSAPAAPASPAAPAACTTATCGSTMMTMTDAAGDFLTYQVNLVSLQLQRADGTMVETLPQTTAVDFVQLIDLSEILSARQIPPGSYVAAQVTVDYSNAVIMVDDGTGTGIAVKPVNSSGAALAQLQLMVKLDNKNSLNIKAATTSRIAFDFNLLASNMVDLTAKTDTVSPVLVASVVPIDNKQIRVRGEITAVDTGGSDYTIQVDPFNNHDNDKFSPLMVHTTDTTTFEINGTPFAGSAGLAQLAALPADTISVALGTIQASDQTFTASSVLAGTSVAGAGMDHIVGNVISRTGNTLTVHGARMDDHGNDRFIAGSSTVTIAAATSVTAQGQAAATPAHTIAEISVGSLIDAFGTAGTDNNGNVTLDATAGRVRLDFTQVQGAVNTLNTGAISLNLQTIDRQPVSLFNFAGTGSANGMDSNPAKYVVSTAALDLSQLFVGGSALGIGFVNPFGSAPPDFTAMTIATGTIVDNNNDNNVCNGNSGGPGNNNCCNSNSGDSGSNNCTCNGNSGGSGSDNCMCNGNSGGSGSDNCMCNGNSGGSGSNNCNNVQTAQLDINWSGSGTPTPFKSLAATGLDLDRANTSIGNKHAIQVDPQDVDIEMLASDVIIVGATSGMTLFSITGQNGGETDNFGSFADFESALAGDLNGTTTALRMTATGQYDAASNTFTAQRITVLLSNN
jgi:hypothetical protein